MRHDTSPPHRPQRPVAFVAWSAIAGVYLYLAPDCAWAIQSHGPPEGLYTHQLAHALFALSMAVLAYWLQANRFTLQRGWRLIQMSCVLFIFWNLTAFAGHFVETSIPADLIIGQTGSWDQRVLTGAHPLTAAYCILKLDHFVCVPAILCLFLGIRRLYTQALLQTAQGK